MKQQHNIKPGQTRDFKHLGELQEFAETYEHNASEFNLKITSKGLIEITKK